MCARADGRVSARLWTQWIAKNWWFSSRQAASVCTTVPKWNSVSQLSQPPASRLDHCSEVSARSLWKIAGGRTVQVRLQIRDTVTRHVRPTSRESLSRHRAMEELGDSVGPEFNRPCCMLGSVWEQVLSGSLRIQPPASSQLKHEYNASSRIPARSSGTMKFVAVAH